MTLLRASEFVNLPAKRKRCEPLTAAQKKAIRSYPMPDRRKGRAEMYLELARKYDCSARTIMFVYLGK
jgi:hypothetical protein